MSLECILKEMRRQQARDIFCHSQRLHQHANPHTKYKFSYLQHLCASKAQLEAQLSIPCVQSVIADVDRSNLKGGLTLLQLRIWGLKKDAISVDVICLHLA